MRGRIGMCLCVCVCVRVCVCDRERERGGGYIRESKNPSSLTTIYFIN